MPTANPAAATEPIGDLGTTLRQFGVSDRLSAVIPLDAGLRLVHLPRSLLLVSALLCGALSSGSSRSHDVGQRLHSSEGGFEHPFDRYKLRLCSDERARCAKD